MQVHTTTPSAEDRIFRQYYRDVSLTKMPRDGEEERELFSKYHEHQDEDARRRLVEGGLRFVIKTARQYHRGNMEFLKTLIAAGNVGLMVAVDRYMPWVIVCPKCSKKNYVPQPKHQRCPCGRALPSREAKRYTTRFLTYAAWWISEAIRTELYESSLIHVPAYRQKEQFRSQNPDAVVGYHYVNYEDAHDRLSISGEDDATISNARRLLHTVLRRMKDRQAYVLIAYYGLREDPKTLREISAKIGVCPERVRQIKVDAMVDLRKRLERLRVEGSADVFVN
jgi:RNA polymerase sigma factor (sigma-70 family)